MPAKGRRNFFWLTAMSYLINLKSSTFYKFLYTVFYILQHDFDLNLHLHQTQNSTFYKIFLTHFLHSTSLFLVNSTFYKITARPQNESDTAGSLSQLAIRYIVLSHSAIRQTNSIIVPSNN